MYDAKPILDGDILRRERASKLSTRVVSDPGAPRREPDPQYATPYEQHLTLQQLNVKLNSASRQMFLLAQPRTANVTLYCGCKQYDSYAQKLILIVPIVP